MRYPCLSAILTLQLFLIGSACAQPPDILWTRTFGGHLDEQCKDAQQTLDGGFILAGITNSFSVGGYDMFLVKVDSLGNLVWQRTYGGANDEDCKAVQQTRDGGYILAGHTYSTGLRMPQRYLVKTDSLGNFQWDFYYGQTPFGYGYYDVLQATDGGYTAIDNIGSPGASNGIEKFVADGSLQWSHDLPLGWGTLVWSFDQTSDDGYIIGGGPSLSDIGDCFVIKLNFLGFEQWTVLNITPSVDDHCFSILQLSSGDYMLGGASLLGDHDMTLIKLNSQGQALWQRSYGGDNEDIGFSLRQTFDGGFVLGGETESYGLNGDMYAIKTNSVGELEWEINVGGAGWESCHAMQQIRDGGYMLAGTTSSYGAGGNDMYLVRLTPDIAAVPPTPSANMDYSLQFTANPNPFNAQCRLIYQLPLATDILLRVFDPSGRQIADLVEGWSPAGEYSVSFDARSLPSGLYFARLTAGGFQRTQKILLVK